jgi:hypothetical protein
MTSPPERRPAGAVEVTLVAVAAVVVWRLVMGWDWSSVPTSDPNVYRAPQTGVDWSLVYLAAMLGSGWLAFRGRPLLGPVVVVAPLVVLSGWRMAAAEVIGANLWPIGLAIVLVTMGAAAGVAAVTGRWLRRRDSAHHSASPTG